MLSSAIYADGFVGHAPLIERLESLLEKERLPHAILFCGPDGVGKRRVANWLAAAYLCPDKGCNRCPTCRRVILDRHPDYHALGVEEGRRDILIGQVRELMRAIGTKPFESSGKAAVIDGADRMNEESQNAFLKTLEEPPPNTLIVLVSAATERLLPTIRSRCQRFSFGRLSEEELERFASLREGLEMDFPLRLAEGSPGRLLRFVQEEAGRARRIFTDFIASKVPPSPVRSGGELMEWAQEAGGLRQVLRERLKIALGLAAAILRDVLVVKEGGGRERLVNSDLENRIREAAIYYHMTGLYHAVNGVVEASEDVASYVDPGLAAENVFRIIRDVRKRG